MLSGGDDVAPSRYGESKHPATVEVAPERDEFEIALVREARRVWGVENNIYQLGHRGYVAVKGGARDCPYTFMQDMVAGRYTLPWENEVRVTDGTSCGFAAPTREYAPQALAAEKKYA